MHTRPYLWFLLIITLAAADLFIKWLLTQYLEPQTAYALIPHLNGLLTTNRGVAFGWFDNPNLHTALMAVTLTVICVILRFYLKYHQQFTRLQHWGYSLIIAGAMANAFERVFNGQVTDYIDFYISTWHFATFNLADSMICCGVLLLIMSRSD